MIERRAADNHGRTEFDGASAVHHFCFGRYQAVDRVGWGRLRVMNCMVLAADGKRQAHPLGGMEVVIIVESGEITLTIGDRDMVLRGGEVAAVTMGLGSDYGFHNSGGHPASVIEIWLVDDSLGLPKIASQRWPAGPSVLASALAEDAPLFELTGSARISRIEPDPTACDPIPLRGCGPAYALALAGSATVAGIACEAGDGLAIAPGITALPVSAASPSSLLLIETLDFQVARD